MSKVIREFSETQDKYYEPCTFIKKIYRANCKNIEVVRYYNAAGYSVDNVYENLNGDKYSLVLECRTFISSLEQDLRPFNLEIIETLSNEEVYAYEYREYDGVLVITLYKRKV